MGGEDVQGLVPARLPQSLAQSGNVCSTTRGNGTLVVPNAVLVEGERSTTERSFLWATPVDETGRRKRVRVYIGAGLFAVIGLAVGLAVALIENWTSIESARFNHNNFTGSMPAGICTAFFLFSGLTASSRWNVRVARNVLKMGCDGDQGACTQIVRRKQS